MRSESSRQTRRSPHRRRSKPTRRSSRSSSRRSKRRSPSRRRSKREGFTFRGGVFSKLLFHHDPLFEQWGDDTLYPPANPSEDEPPEDVKLQCGVECRYHQICKQRKDDDSLFCEFHKEDAKDKTKEYHKNDGYDYLINAVEAMRIIPLRIRVYLMYRSSLNHSSTDLSDEKKNKFEKIAQGHLDYITENLLKHWDTKLYGEVPINAEALVNSFQKWKPQNSELVRAKYRPSSYNWKLATVVAVDDDVIRVQFKGFNDVVEVEKEYVKPSYFAMPPKTVFLKYVFDEKPCIMLLKGSGYLRGMEWSVRPDQPVWDLLAVIFDGKNIMFTNIVSKQSVLEAGRVTLPLPSSILERLEFHGKFKMETWYESKHLLASRQFATYMNDELSEVMCLLDAKIRKADFSIDVDNVFDIEETKGILTSSMADNVVSYHFNKLEEEILRKRKQTKHRDYREICAKMKNRYKYLSDSNKNLVSFKLKAPLKIPDDTIIREVMQTFKEIKDKKKPKLLVDKFPEVAWNAFQTIVTVKELEGLYFDIWASQAIRMAMETTSWLNDPEKKNKTIHALKILLKAKKYVWKSQLPQHVLDELDKNVEPTPPPPR